MRTSGVLAALVAGALTTSPGRSADRSILESTAVSWEEIEARRASGRSQVFRHPTATLDELELHVTVLPPGQSPHPAHEHPNEEIVIIKEGTLEATVNGHTHRVGPGAVLFMASNQPHTVRNVGEVPAVYHVINWRSPGTPKETANR